MIETRVGTDIVEVSRINKLSEEHGHSFFKHVFTDLELSWCQERKIPGMHLAGRFAAKEAVTKALGTGLSSGVFFKDIGVENDKYGKPSIVLTGGAKLRLKNILPKNHKANINLTITDDFPWAQAIVIIEAITE